MIEAKNKKQTKSKQIFQALGELAEKIERHGLWTDISTNYSTEGGKMAICSLIIKFKNVEQIEKLKEIL